ncbi:MAG: acyl-CoA dehydrogenase family protein [Acidimicrobiales bacterium]|nr:acyl-CoA dehydrogenase family protein [Acidimicrobiales bacterium]
MSSQNGVAEEAAAWFAENWDLESTLGQWWRRLAESGWGFPSWPLGRYGRGLRSAEATAVLEARRRAGVMGPPSGIATMLAGPTLLAHGTPDQLDRFLPGIATGEHVWCQLFSEPGAGSDLASLRTRAERDGDQWVVNGQKVWTSGAHKSTYGILIARTDPDVPKHSGITYFVIDMRQPGVEVRPLRELTGRSVFNEVFLTDAIVPAENLVGDVNAGWGVTMTTLANERSGLSVNATGGGGRLDIPGHRLGARVADLLAEAAAEMERAAVRPRGHRLLVELARSRGKLDDPLVRREIARAYAAGEVARISAVRAQAAAETARARGAPGSETSPLVSVQKMAASQNLHRLGRAAVDIQGPYGMLAGPDALEDDRAFETIATAFMISIGGGTDQIQRNIVGERVLGLPGEPRTDKDLPFRQLTAGA